MDDNTVQEAIEKVEEILTPKKFNIVDAIKGRSYPEDSITLYFDEQAAYELYLVNEQMSSLAQDEDGAQSPEGLEPLEEQAEALRQRIIESSYKFTLRGRDRIVYDNIVDDMEKNYQGDHRAREENIRCLAKSIVSVEDHEGNVDDHEFTDDEVRALYETLPRPEWDRLIHLLWSLTFANSYFDKAVDAGFLSRR